MTIYKGTSGDDRITGGNRNNIFRMEDGGNDVVIGGNRFDQFFFGSSYSGRDKVDGGLGNGDTIYVSGHYGAPLHFISGQIISVEGLEYDAHDSYSVILDNRFSGDKAGANFFVSSTFDSLDALGTLTFDGSAVKFNNLTAVGAAGDDVLTGGRAADELRGWGGADVIVGGNGDDLIYGGTGADTLTGGFGADRFGYDSDDLGTPGVIDTITDFRDGDRIDLSAVDVAFHIGTSGGRAGGILAHYSRATDETTVRIFVDRDSQPDLVIHLDGNHAHLTPADFVFHG